MDIQTLLPSIILSAVAIPALVVILSNQHKARQFDILSSFRSLRIIALGVKHSGWPIEVLIAEMQSSAAELGQSLPSSSAEGILRGLV